MKKELWVLPYIWKLEAGSELDEESEGLLEAGRAIAERLDLNVCVLVAANDPRRYVDQLGKYNIDKIGLCEIPPIEQCSTETIAWTVASLVKKHEPTMILIMESFLGSDLAPRIAAELQAPLIANCTEITGGERGDLSFLKTAYEGKAALKLSCIASNTVAVTIQAEMFTRAQAEITRAKSTEIVTMTPDPYTERSRVKHLGSRRADPQSIDIAEAELIVALGGGVRTPEDLALVRELAKMLGASVAGSRPAVDHGWISLDRQVGYSGKTVSPRVYIACGISGAIQHTTGMRNSKLVVAIDKDPNARIFEIADISLVGELNQVVPMILERLQRQQATKVHLTGST